VAPRTLLPETDDPLTAAPPVELVGVLTAGAVLGGVRVAELVVRTVDGREQVLQLVAPVAPLAGRVWAKTKAGKAILDVLAGEGRAIKGQSIARLARVEYSGSFRQTLKGLADAGEIDHNDGEYSLPE